VKRVPRSFFERDPVSCARELIGCTLGLGEARGVIVETEAYAAEGDRACHTWRRPSARRFVAENGPGTAYVYLNYGMHWLFNFLVKEGEQDGFVLVRALEPTSGVELMAERRGGRQRHELCNGPAKLTGALGISGEHHGGGPFGDNSSGEQWVLGWEESPRETIASTRIGISLDKDFPWRFLAKGSSFVSVPA
jgi:DNA-3-methyladenine glycosylase